jgi:hypothetical protein
MRLSAVHRAVRRFAGLLAGVLFLAAECFAGQISGTITNGTTGKPANGVDLILFELQGTMKQAATAKTDASGHYSIDSPLLGTGPMLLRAVYHGVNYHEPVVPGKTTIDMEVFEPTDKASAFSVTARAIILQPSSSGLTVGEEYNIQNNTQPPVAFYKADGSFRFSLPDGAQLSDVSAVGGTGMPVVETPIDKGHNQQAIVFPFRPGTSGVRLTYHLPYANNSAQMSFSSPYGVDRLAIFAAPSVTVSGGGFSPAGQDQGLSVYMRESVPANTPVAVSISGTAPPLSADNGGGGDDSQNPSVNSRADSGAQAAPTASITTIPARLDSLKWVLVAGFALIFALGLGFLWRQPAPALDGPAPVGAAVAAPLPAPQSTPAPATAPSVANVTQEVRGSLDELKDTLFRLELRHEAGTITAEDYARERDRIQKLLRDLVKG